MEFLNSKNINSGFISENISLLLKLINNKTDKIDFIEIAKYQPEQNGRDSEIIWMIDLKNSKFICDEENTEKINHKETNANNLVTEEQIICIKKKIIEGTNGILINGKIIEAKAGKDLEIIPMKNIKSVETEKEVKYIANTSGILKVCENKLYVEETLIIDSNIDYYTGNIRFFKDIIINGNIISGFTVASEQNITINGCVEDGAFICAGGDIEVNGGIIGENTRISSGNDIIANYVHLSKLICKNDIIIKKFVLHAKLTSKNNIIVKGENLKDKKSSVIGSILSAINLIEVNSVGAKFAACTEFLICDINKKIELYNKKINKLKKENALILNRISENINLKLSGISDIISNMNKNQKKAFHRIIEQLKLINSEITKIEYKKKRKIDLTLKKMITSKIVIQNQLIPPVKFSFYTHSKKILNEKNSILARFSKNPKKPIKIVSIDYKK